MYLHATGFPIHLYSGARQLVKALPIHLYGAVHRWNLLDDADKSFQGRLNLGLSDSVETAGGRYLAFCVVGAG